MRMVEWCPYPGTCRYRGPGDRCSREECPFRIHARRLVAGEIQRLEKAPSLTGDQRRELAFFKGEYARLLASSPREG